MRNLNKSLISPPQKSLRNAYLEYDIETYYQKFGDDYRNPHEAIVTQILELANQQWNLDWQRVLDLACGSGEVTLALENMGILNVEAIDPFTYKNYQKRTGKIARQFSFEEIATGALTGEKYSLIICSFALHLVPESRLPILLYHLGLVSNHLLIITPHKRPEIKPAWGWLSVDEIYWQKVRARLYTKDLQRFSAR